MRGIKNKESGKWKKAVFFFVLLLMLIVLLNSVKNVYQKKKTAEEILVRMEKETENLRDREEYLKESLARLATQEGIKFEMRKKLNVAEVGESVAIIVDEEEAASVSDIKISTWQKIKNFLADLNNTVR